MTGFEASGQPSKMEGGHSICSRSGHIRKGGDREIDYQFLSHQEIELIKAELKLSVFPRSSLKGRFFWTTRNQVNYFNK